MQDQKVEKEDEKTCHFLSSLECKFCVPSCGTKAFLMDCDYCGKSGLFVCNGFICKRESRKKSFMCMRCQRKHRYCRHCQIVVSECGQTFPGQKILLHDELACGFIRKRWRACGHCGEREERGRAKLKLCGVCKDMWYCDEKCQKRDWKFHKIKCSNKAKK